jgi:hypothetical protein
MNKRPKGITYRANRANPYTAYISLTNKNVTFQKVIGNFNTIKAAVYARNAFIDSLK